MKPIKLNKEKRELLKNKWKHIVMNNMPLEVDDNLKEAQENYRTVRSDVWDNVITPNVEANFPMADMKILEKYERRNHYSSFTDTDRCFVFKPNFTDDITEKRFDWNMCNDQFNALYHNELLSVNCEPTLCVEYEETQRSPNPHYHQAVIDMKENYSSIAKANGTYEDFALLKDYPSSYNSNDSCSESDYGKYTKVVVSGSCHSRVMMLSDEDEWTYLESWGKAQSRLTNAHRELWKVKYQLITDMNSIIEQAKFIADVEQYWTNVRDCVNFENNEISRELSIVSEDTKSRLSQAINNIDVGKPDSAVIVSNQNFAMVD